VSQILKNRALRILVFLFIIASTFFLLLHREEITKFYALGYPGIFIISVLSNATLIFPIPGVLFTSAMGAVFNPFWVAMIAGSGAAIGELTGYLAGYSGQTVIERYDWYKKSREWVVKYGDWAVLVLALIPNPVFDLTGFAAGALKMPVWRFFFWCWIGKIVKMLFFSFGGAAVISYLAK
jgi:uncharacterized membrane protein YdjX (TVP38/TMEM64 family)